ncbi:Hypothetical protein PBC10988_34540 [Planctomycetales bacterium 10988]|nr:Hypothetical protein PBC10988_34540 [Planctomycetales bacterium 10988]
MKKVMYDEIGYNGDDGLYYYRDEFPFTGIAVYPDFEPTSTEEEYRDGVLWGDWKEWWPSGQLAVLTQFKYGCMHGSDQRWYENGKPQEEGEYELGICKRRKKWGEDGILVEEFALEDGSDMHTHLLELRRLCYGQTGEKRGDEESQHPESSQPE